MDYQDFRFIVEHMTVEQAQQLLEYINEHVADLGLVMSGGFRPTTDADYEAQDGKASQR